MVRGWFGETENSEPKKRENTIKIGVSGPSLGRSGPKEPSKNLKKKIVQNSPPQKRPRIVALSARWFFRVFGASPKKGPKKHENTIKIVASCFCRLLFRRAFSGETAGEGIWSPDPGDLGA